MSILVAVDGASAPDQTVAVGNELAQAFGVELIIVHVMPQERADEQSERRPDYYLDDAVEEAEKKARTVTQQTIDDPERVSYRGRVGAIDEEIFAEANRRDPRYLIIGGRKRTPVGKIIFGSVTQSVLLNATHPTVVVPKEGYTRRKGEANPVVGSITRSEKATQVIQETYALADALDRDPHIIHVLKDDEAKEGEGVGVEDTDQALISEDIRKIAAQEVAGSEDREFSVSRRVGDPGEQIIEYVNEHNADYLVLTGRKRSPVGKVLFGSVTQSVLLNADNPVLTLMSED